MSKYGWWNSAVCQWQVGRSRPGELLVASGNTTQLVTESSTSLAHTTHWSIVSTRNQKNKIKDEFERGFEEFEYIEYIG